MTQKILFIKWGNFSNINNAVYNILKSKYPQYQIETIDARDLIKHKTSVFCYLTNIYFFLTEYGVDLMSGKKKWSKSLEWFFATSYISILITKKIRKITKDNKYEFTFQTQSLFNGKIANIPNFVYTDHTTKTNLLYPDINSSQFMRSARFIKKSETKTYEDATMIFTFGTLVAHSLITQYQIPKEKILPIFSSSNTGNDRPVNTEKYFSKNILFVGVDWERKGSPILLEVFKNVLVKHPDASLTIIGCSPKNITLPNCNIVGKIPAEQVSNYYNRANIFCLPTMREPFGNVFLKQ